MLPSTDSTSSVTVGSLAVGASSDSAVKPVGHGVLTGAAYAKPMRSRSARALPV